MGSWILSPDDLKRGDLADPGWYPAEIVDYEEKEADTDSSTNCIFHFKLIQEGSFKGIRCQRLFNEKALGFGKNLWKTLDFPFEAGVGYRLSSDLFRQSVGSKLEVYIKRGTSNKGHSFNDVQDFRPLRTSVVSKTA